MVTTTMAIATAKAKFSNDSSRRTLRRPRRRNRTFLAYFVWRSAHCDKTLWRSNIVPQRTQRCAYAKLLARSAQPRQHAGLDR